MEVSGTNMSREYRFKTASWIGEIANASFPVPGSPTGSGVSSTYEGSFFTVYLTELEVKKVEIYYDEWKEAGSPSSLIITTLKYDTEIFIPNFPNDTTSGGSGGSRGKIRLNILEAP